MIPSSKTPITMTGAEENRHYLRAFIHTYRDLPVLWDTTLRDYTNRDKRAEAYEQLVPIYRYLKRDATVEDVKKKINTLRTNYRKELKVVECARRNGNIHQPRCWTFHELDFLRNTEKFLAINSSSRPSDGFPFTENSQTHASFLDTSNGYNNFRALLNNASHASPIHSASSIADMFQKSFGPNATQKFEPPSSHQQASATSNANVGNASIIGEYGAIPHLHNGEMLTAGTATVKRQRVSPSNTPESGNITTGNSSIQNSEELLNMARDYLSASFPEEETIARTWAIKLKRLHRDQRLLAEKFINDILFEAESGTLHRNSVQVNSFEPYVRYEDQNQTDEDNNHQQSSHQHHHQQQHHPHAKSQSPSIHTSSTTTASVTEQQQTQQSQSQSQSQSQAQATPQQQQQHQQKPIVPNDGGGGPAIPPTNSDTFSNYS